MILTSCDTGGQQSFLCSSCIWPLKGEGTVKGGGAANGGKGLAVWPQRKEYPFCSEILNSEFIAIFVCHNTEVFKRSFLCHSCDSKVTSSLSIHMETT